MKAHGYLQHHFWGDYSAGIALQFECTESAIACLPHLPGFTTGAKHPEVLVANLDRNQLEAFKAKLPGWHCQIDPCGFPHCRDQCRTAEIDNLNHSVDSGATWIMDIPAEPLNQLALFDATASP